MRKANPDTMRASNMPDSEKLCVDLQTAAARIDRDREWTKTFLRLGYVDYEVLGNGRYWISVTSLEEGVRQYMRDRKAEKTRLEAVSYGAPKPQGRKPKVRDAAQQPGAGRAVS